MKLNLEQEINLNVRTHRKDESSKISSLIDDYLAIYQWHGLKENDKLEQERFIQS